MKNLTLTEQLDTAHIVIGYKEIWSLQMFI